MAALWPALAAPALFVAAALMGLPVGVILALPSAVLRPESRAVGMGLFYSFLYIGHGLLPPLAGWIDDLLPARDAALLACAGFVLAMLPIHAAVRRAAPLPAVPAAP